MNATEVTQPAVGELWAYRARNHDPLVQVAVVRLGVKTPRRVLVRFVDEAFEGLQDWVPPARLKAPWARMEEFKAREHRWDAVVAFTPPDRDGPEESAAGTVIDLLVASKLATTGWNATRGTIRMHDVAGLAAFLEVDPSGLRVDGVSFEENGDLISPWPITLAIARRAAERDPHAVLRSVERGEGRTARGDVRLLVPAARRPRRPHSGGDLRERRRGARAACEGTPQGVVRRQGRGPPR